MYYVQKPSKAGGDERLNSHKFSVSEIIDQKIAKNGKKK